MNTHQDRPDGLPLRGGLSRVNRLSFLLALLMAAASLTGLLYPVARYPQADQRQTFLPTDISILFIGLPLLLASMSLARRGSLVGLLLWPGALFFSLYTYSIYALAMPLWPSFALHIVLAGLSGFTLAALFTRLDLQRIQQTLAGTVPERLGGGILAGLGLLFFVRAAGVILTALSDRAAVSAPDIALNTVDLLIAPAWVICGVLLWQRKAFGYITGLGLLFQASMLFIGLIVILLVQPLVIGTPLALVDIGVVFAFWLIPLIPFILFARGVASAGSA